MDSNPLVGRIIERIYLSEDQGAIKFVLRDQPPVVAIAYGDCCSSTWIEDVISPENVIGAEVTSVEDIELPDELQDPTTTDNFEEEMQYYGFTIRTARGSMLIAYRNSSNGYYGGELAWPGDYENRNNNYEAEWREVTDGN